MVKGYRVVLWLCAYVLFASVLQGHASHTLPVLVDRQTVAQLAKPFRQPKRGQRDTVDTDTSEAVALELAALLAVPAGTAKEGEQVPEPGTWPAFLWQLRELRDGKRDKVRVIHLGDSELVADGTSSAIRAELAERFGLGGLGFTLAAQPLPWYLRDHWRHRPGSGFRVWSYPMGQLETGRYGPGGVAFEGPPGSRARVTVKHPVAGACKARFYYGYRARGGSVELYADDTVIGKVETSRWEPGTGVYERRFDSCPKDLALLTQGAYTTVFGWSIEYDRPGIVWSSLGVISAQLPQLAHYDGDNLIESLSLLEPDLVVLTFGLNLAAAPWAPHEVYEKNAADMMRRVREATHGVPCLVTSPYPVGYPTADGYAPEANAAEIITGYQRRAAEKVGCVFIDRFRLSGGASAARRWVAAHPKILTGDYQHLTVEGSRRMGRAIAGVILASFDERRRDHAADFALDRQPRGAL